MSRLLGEDMALRSQGTAFYSAHFPQHCRPCHVCILLRSFPFNQI